MSPSTTTGLIYLISNQVNLLKQAMRFNSIPTRILLTSLLYLMVFNVQAQEDVNKDICENIDCLEGIMEIELNEPIKPDPNEGFSARRTNRFKEAYLTFQRIKQSYANRSEWQSNYNQFGLRGKNCLRHYQLESYFATEYLQNPDFKKFIDDQQVDGLQFEQLGFNSSRRGINLERRMSTQCPEEIRKMNRQKLLNKEGMTIAYRDLGKALGYFDDKGNPTESFFKLEQEKTKKEKVKKDKRKEGDAKEESTDPPITTTANTEEKGREQSTPATNTKPVKLSKKEQIAELKNQVAQLPNKEESEQKINTLAQAIEALDPKLNALNEHLKDEEARTPILQTAPSALSNKLGSDEKDIQQLQNFQPQVDRPKLTEILTALTERKEKLENQTDQLTKSGKKLKDDYEKARKNGEALENDFNESKANIDQLRNQIDEIDQKKTELTGKLEDKPRKILEELTQDIAQTSKAAEDFAKDLEKENKNKDQLTDRLENLDQDKNKLEQQLQQLKTDTEKINQAEGKLDNYISATSEAIENIKQEEAKIDKAKQALMELPSSDDLKDAIASCKEELLKLKGVMESMEDSRNSMTNQTNSGEISPNDLLDRLTQLELDISKFKLSEAASPIAAQIDEETQTISKKANTIGSMIEIIANSKKRSSDNLGQFDDSIDRSNRNFENLVSDMDKLEEQVDEISASKSKLMDQLNQAKSIRDVQVEIDNFKKAFAALEQQTKCDEIQTLKDNIGALKTSLDNAGQGNQNTQDDLSEVAGQVESLENEFIALRERAKEESQRAIKLKEEESALQGEFGDDVKVKPVTTKEWSDNFTVERPYWEASYHPDKEMVEGYRGRYFEVNLKDATKNTTILFPIGKYFMDKKSFRKQYGATIGSFVIEALFHLKNNEAGKVKLFIQGSADAVGSNSFRGQLDGSYLYENIAVLPTNGSERFKSEPITVSVPQTNFVNSDLPNLRAQYLKEMITAYTEKFDPILLQGSVTTTQDAKQRNAIIYLFLPEEVLKNDD